MYLDPRFLKVVELSFAADSQFWYAVIRDESDQPVAVACFSRYRVDVAMMAPPLIQKFVANIRCIWPRFFQFQMLFCGLPLSSAACYLAMDDRADHDRILASLNETAMGIARQIGVRLISFQQFSPALAMKLDGLIRYGFRKARSSYNYELHGEFASFTDYLATLKGDTRWRIRRTLRRFDDAGLTCEQIRGRDGADRYFTPEVYQLYLNVLDQAKVRLECKPIRFFQELARQFPDESYFTFARQNERIVGFCCGLASGHQYSLLVVGLDYSINRETNLYFNLVYRMMQQALVPGVNLLHFGATADEFKQRLGCRGSWLSIYVKASKPVAQLVLNRLFDKLFDTRDSTNAPPPSGTH